MPRDWGRDCCVVVEKDFDKDLHSFDVYALDGSALGEIIPADMGNYSECVVKLEVGECPICDKWDDGLGNTCSLEGWGEWLDDYMVDYPHDADCGCF